MGIGVVVVVVLACIASIEAALTDWVAVNGFLEGLVFESGLVGTGTAISVFNSLEVRPGLTVQDLVSAGTVELKDVTCGQGVVDGTSTMVNIVGVGEVRSVVVLDSVSLNCNGTVVYSSLTMPSLGVSNLDGESNFTLAKGASVASASLGGDLVWEIGPGRQAGVDPDRPVNASVENCLLAVPSDWSGLTTNVPPQSDFELLLELLSREMVSRAVVCSSANELIAQSFGAGVANINDQADELVLKDFLNVTEAEQSMLSQLSTVQKDSIIQFPSDGLAQVAVKIANQVLGSPPDNTTSVLTINTVVERATNSSTGLFEIDLSRSNDFTGEILGGNAVLHPVVTVNGFNTFTAFDAFNIVSDLDHTLTSFVELTNLEITTSYTLKLVTQGATFLGGNLVANNPLDFNFTLNVALPTVTVNLTSSVASNPEEIEQVQLGQLDQDLLSCASPAFYLVNFSRIELQPLTAPILLTVSSLEDSGINAAQVTDLVDKLWRDSLQNDFPGITKGLTPTISDLINDIIQDQTAQACDAYQPNYPLDTLLDFVSDDFEAFQNVINQTLVNVNDPNVGINRIVREISSLNGSPSGVIELNETFTLNLDIDENSFLTINITNIRLENVDTFDYLTLLKPQDSNTVLTEVGFGGGARKFILHLEAVLVGKGSLEMNEVVEFDVEITNLDFSATTTLNVIKYNLMSLSLEQLVSVPCLLGTLDYDGPNLGFVAESASISMTDLEFDCVGCDLSSVQKQELSDDIKEGLTTFLPIVVGSAKSGDGKFAINNGLQEFSQECNGPVPKNQVVDKYENAGVYSVLFVNAAIYSFVIAGLSISVCVTCKKKRHQIGRVDDEREKTDPSNADLVDGGNDQLSLFADPQVPIAMKLLVPTLFGACLFLFLSANLSVGASVVVTTVINKGDPFVIDDLFDLSLAGTINDTFNGGIPLIGVLIALFSGCWPYVRLVLLLYCVLMSPKGLTPYARGNLLSALDFLGKWAIVDQFLIVVLIVVFDIEVVFPAAGETFSLFNEKFLQLDVQLVPAWGIYGFFLGAVLSNILNHIVSSMHRRVTSPSSSSKYGIHLPREIARAIRKKARLVMHIFTVKDRETQQPKLQMRFGAATKLYVTASTITCCLLIFVSLFVKTISFQYLGAGGKGLAFTERDSDKRSFSLMDFVLSLTSQGDDVSESLGIAFLQVFFTTTVLVIPVMQQIMLCVLFWAPFTIREQRAATFILETFAAWSSFEVFVAAIIFSVGFIGAFVQLALRKLCVDIDELINDWIVPFGLLAKDEAKCFTMTGKLEGSFFILILASVLGLLNAYTINSMSRLAIEEREAKLRLERKMCDSVVVMDGPRDYTEKSIGCWNSSIKRHARLLSKLGFVQVRRVPPSDGLVAAGGHMPQQHRPDRSVEL